MKIIEQYLADRKLKETIAGLNFSKGMTESPDHTIFADTSPGLKEYLSALKVINDSLAEVADKPEVVHCGLQSQVPGTELYRQERSWDDPARETPPRYPHLALLDEFQAKDAATAVKHLTQLTAANRGISPEDQEKLVTSALQDLKKMRGAGARVQIDSDWQLNIGILPYPDGQKCITTYLIPVEKPEYAENLIRETTKLLAENIKPENLSKVVHAAAETNFCLKSVDTSSVDPLNIGGFIGAEKLVREQGWQPVKDADILDESTLWMLLDQTEIYLHGSHRAQDPVPLLGKKNFVRNETIKFSAIPSPALREKIKDEYHKRKLVPAAQEIIQSRIQKAGNGKGNGRVDLSPKSIALEALDKTGQTGLQEADREGELNLLSTTVAHVLVARLRRHPETRPVAERIDLFLAMAEDQSVLAHHPKAVIKFGYRPENDQFFFPVDWFQK